MHKQRIFVVVLRVLASYEPEIAKICILACNSATKPPFQNPPKSLFAQWSKDVKKVRALFTATEHRAERFFVRI